MKHVVMTEQPTFVCGNGNDQGAEMTQQVVFPAVQQGILTSPAP